MWDAKQNKSAEAADRSDHQVSLYIVKHDIYSWKWQQKKSLQISYFPAMEIKPIINPKVTFFVCAKSIVYLVYLFRVYSVL